MTTGDASAELLISVVLIGWLLQFTHYFVLSNQFSKPKDFSNLKARLDGYAWALKGKRVRSVYGTELILSKDSHEILLGTLKKVEAKNTSLLAILVFALAISLTAVVSDNDHHLLSQLFSVTSLLLLPGLICSLLGMRQIDQKNFIALIKLTPKDTAKSLQRDLMADLIDKEKYFRFTRFWVGLIVATFLIILFGSNVLVLEVIG